MEELVAIAKIIKTRGLRGEIIADLLTDFPERFEGLTDVVGQMPEGGRLDLKIEKFWFQKGRVVLKLDGYDTIDASEMLREVEICVPESETVELERGEFFDWQLAGCRVETLNGDTVGIVSEIMRTGGTEILVVRDGAREVLIPFAETICTDVDVEKKMIRVDPPDGLLEL